MTARPRIAIVGAGPAGAFAVAAALRQVGDAEIDLFERLPTPWGLLRGGVAALPSPRGHKGVVDAAEFEAKKGRVAEADLSGVAPHELTPELATRRPPAVSPAAP